VTNHSATLPNFITAASPQALRRLMFLTNSRKGAMLEYFGIQSYEDRDKTRWIAWFYEPLDRIEDLDNAEG
jgi:hypothetical protein